MISFSSLPMFAGSLAAGIAYTGISILTTAVHTTVNFAGLATETVVGIVGGPWLQTPFRIVRSIAQPIMERTSQTAVLSISVATGAVVGSTVYIGQRLFSGESILKKLKKQHKNEEWVVITGS